MGAQHFGFKSEMPAAKKRVRARYRFARARVLAAGISDLKPKCCAPIGARIYFFKSEMVLDRFNPAKDVPSKTIFRAPFCCAQGSPSEPLKGGTTFGLFDYFGGCTWRGYGSFQNL